MKTKLTMLRDFEALFKQNPKPAVPVKRGELVKRLLGGETINLTDIGVQTFVLQSGRVSGKTQHDEYAAIADITQGTGDMWYVRSEDGDIRRTIFTSTLSTISNMGYTYSNGNYADFKVCYSPFEITHNYTGNKIQFFAINKDINRSKGMMPPTGKLKRVMVEEANEVDEPIYIDALITTAVRFFDENSKIVFRLNPPLTRQHWSVQYFKDKIKNGAIEIYTTWIQLAKLNMLSPATISEILQMKTNDNRFYRYWYLGDMVNMQGLVFPHFDIKKHLVQVEKTNVSTIISRFVVAGDAANKNDATAFGLLAILNDGRVLVLDSFYYDPVKEGIQLDDVELAKMVCDWFDRCLQRYPNIRLKNFSGTVDNANWNLLRMLEQSNSMGWFRWFPATNKNILRDTNRLRTMFREDMILFNSDSITANKSITDEIENYIYDPKTNDIKKGQTDHGIDMLKYGTFLYMDTKVFF